MFVGCLEGLVLSVLEWGRIGEVENLIYIQEGFTGQGKICLLSSYGKDFGSSRLLYWIIDFYFYLEQMPLFTPTLQGSLFSNFIGANQDHSAFRIVIYSDCNSSIFEAVIVVAVFAFMQITELSV